MDKGMGWMVSGLCRCLNLSQPLSTSLDLSLLLENTLKEVWENVACGSQITDSLLCFSCSWSFGYGRVARMLMVWSLWTPAEPQPLCAVKEQTRADAKGNDMCDCCGGNENATKWAIKERKPHTHMHTRAHTHT